MMTSCSRSISISVLRTQHGDYHITVFMLGLSVVTILSLRSAEHKHPDLTW